MFTIILTNLKKEPYEINGYDDVACEIFSYRST